MNWIFEFCRQHYHSPADDQNMATATQCLKVLLHTSPSGIVTVVSPCWGMQCTLLPIFKFYCRNIAFSFLFPCSVIGTPDKEQWPSESAITPDQFAPYSKKPWLQLLPEACQHAQSLLSVGRLCFDYRTSHPRQNAQRGLSALGLSCWTEQSLFKTTQSSRDADSQLEKASWLCRRCSSLTELVCQTGIQVVS